jgi:hypothetical protein
MRIGDADLVADVVGAKQKLSSPVFCACSSPSATASFEAQSPPAHRIAPVTVAPAQGRRRGAPATGESEPLRWCRPAALGSAATGVEEDLVVLLVDERDAEVAHCAVAITSSHVLDAFLEGDTRLPARRRPAHRRSARSPSKPATPTTLPSSRHHPPA